MITDTASQQITLINFSLESESESAPFVIRVDARQGFMLKAEDNDDVRVLAREAESEDSFVDIATAPIDLTPWDGEQKDFELKLTTSAVSLASVAIPVRVTNQ
ncbi:MAG: hypothetical protein WBP93_09450 [Pyrinomonadaceae bacterium]